MSDVVLATIVGAVIGVVAAVVGAVVQGVVNFKFQTEAEKREDGRARRERVVQIRLDALDQTYRQLVIGAEAARASAVGESEEQQASLRRQSESSNFLEADATLVGDPATVTAYLERTRWWLMQPKGIQIRPTDLTEDAELSNQLAASIRRARERIIEDAGS
jgi:hypothetical protein